jgi:hypothetical protein
VSWELDTDALQCNTTADLKKIRSVIQSENSEAFLVRISAGEFLEVFGFIENCSLNV